MATSTSKSGIVGETYFVHNSDDEFEFVEAKDLKLVGLEEDLNMKDLNAVEEDSKKDLLQDWTFINDDFVVPEALDAIEISTDFSLFQDVPNYLPEEMNYKSDQNEDQLSWRRKEVKLEKEPRSEYFSGFMKATPYFETWEYYEEPKSMTIPDAENKILAVLDNFDFFPTVRND